MSRLEKKSLERSEGRRGEERGEERRGARGGEERKESRCRCVEREMVKVK